MKIFKALSIYLALGILAGCATTESSNQNDSMAQAKPSPSRQKESRPDGEIIGTPAANSKFAKLRLGMGQREVEDLIGAPSDRNFYQTGKAWIPFYFGKDAYRFETFYKKEGRLTFEGGGVTGSSGRLIRILVNVSESGYK